MVIAGADACQGLPGQNVRILSWNINGLRALATRCAAAKTTLAAELESLNADIICFQETKLTAADLTADIALVDGWTSYFSHYRGARGYSGVATYVRNCHTLTPYQAEEGVTGIFCCSEMSKLKSVDAAASSHAQQQLDPFRPLSFDEDGGGGLDDSEQSHCCAIPGHKQVQEQLSKKEMEEIDREGRCLITDHGSFVIFNVYAHSLCGSENDRHIQKANLFRAIFLRANSLLRQKRRVMIVGDLNVALNPIDRSDTSYLLLSKERSMKRMASAAEGLLTFENNGIRKLLKSALKPQGPFIDAFRKFHPKRPDAYSCWSNATNARQTNYGSRIDLVLYGPDDDPSQAGDCSSLAFCDIWSEKLGSDHCPVWCDVKITERGAPHSPPPLATLNFPHFQAIAKKQLSLDHFNLSKKPRRELEHDNGPGYSLRGKESARPGGTKQKSLTNFLKNSASSYDPASDGPSRNGRDALDDRYQSESQNQTVSEPKLSAGWGTDEIQEEQNNVKSAWMMLLGKANQPMCRCGEPCVERQVKKAGPNYRRRFFVCARPIAVPGHPQGRCNFFQWATKIRQEKVAKKPDGCDS